MENKIRAKRNKTLTLDKNEIGPLKKNLLTKEKILKAHALTADDFINNLSNCQRISSTSFLSMKYQNNILR